MDKAPREYKKQYQIIRPNIVKELSHGAVVSRLTDLVGKVLQIPEEELREIRIAAFLHDIGKLELVKHLDDLEHKLIIEELKYVRTHANMGALILLQNGYSTEIVDMVKCHHENCDGSGYPGNLSKDDIPYGARVIRVCDAFVALTADRPYRNAFDTDTALRIMIDESRYYDVKAFLALMRVVHTVNIQDIIDTTEFETVIKELI